MLEKGPRLLNIFGSQKSTDLPNQTYEAFITRITSDPIQHTDFVNDEIDHLREMDLSSHPDEIIAREALVKHVEAGNIRDVEELMHVAIPSVRERLDLLEQTHENSVKISKKDYMGNTHDAQKALDEFNLFYEKYTTEMREHLLIPEEPVVLLEPAFGDDD